MIDYFTNTWIFTKNIFLLAKLFFIGLFSKRTRQALDITMHLSNCVELCLEKEQPVIGGLEMKDGEGNTVETVHIYISLSEHGGIHERLASLRAKYDALEAELEALRHE